MLTKKYLNYSKLKQYVNKTPITKDEITFV